MVASVESEQPYRKMSEQHSSRNKGEEEEEGSILISEFFLHIMHIMHCGEYWAHNCEYIYEFADFFTTKGQINQLIWPAKLVLSRGTQRVRII